LQAAHNAWEWAEYAGLAAAQYLFARVFKYAPITGPALIRAKDRELAVHADHRGGYQRGLGGNTRGINGKPCGEVIRAINHHINRIRQCFELRGL
jgi:hypothetical protein